MMKHGHRLPRLFALTVMASRHTLIPTDASGNCLRQLKWNRYNAPFPSETIGLLAHVKGGAGRRLNCKISHLHKSVKHDHEHERNATTPTTPTTTYRRVGAVPQSHPGLCGTPVGPSKDTHGTPVPDREGRGWQTKSSTKRPPTNDNKTKTTFESNVLSGNRCSHTRENFHGSGAGSRNQRSTEMLSNKLPSRGSRAPTANHQSRSDAMLSSGVRRSQKRTTES